MADTFWANPTTDPKRAYRWLLYLNNRNIPEWVITKVSQPSFEVSEKEHQFINHKFYYPGRVTWTDVKFTLVDPVNPDATEQLQEFLHRSGYIFPNKDNTNNMTDTISKDRAIQQIPNMRIQLISTGRGRPGSGNESSTARPIGYWELKNPWIKIVTYSELSYESEYLVNAEVTVRYDWAEYIKKD